KGAREALCHASISILFHHALEASRVRRPASVKLDPSALLDVVAEPCRIPIGETDAAMGFRLAHLRRVGGAVNAVAFSARQSDPVHADRVVRPGLDGEGF